MYNMAVFCVFTNIVQSSLPWLVPPALACHPGFIPGSLFHYKKRPSITRG